MNRNEKRSTVLLSAAVLGMFAAAQWSGADTLPAPAQGAPAIGGATVRVDGNPIGTLLGYLDGLALVDLAATASTSGTVLVAQAASLENAPLLELLSPTGYLFHVSTGSLDLPGMAEGELQRTPVIFYDSVNCGGQAYLALRNETGRFGVSQLGNGRLRSANPWIARQGLVLRSPDPADPTPVYMVRRGADVEEVFLQSFKAVVPGASPPASVCVSPPLPPAYDSAVRVEPLDPAEAGVAGTLGGRIDIAP